VVPQAEPLAPLAAELVALAARLDLESELDVLVAESRRSRVR
jgi:hypothetical protein